MTLSILIVEDSQEKRRLIASVVDERGERWHAEYAVDVQGAKVALKRRRFDLVLLDINLPSRQSRPPERGGGLEVLRWLRGKGAAHMPRFIVGVTAYEQSFDEASPDFNTLLWKIVLTTSGQQSWTSALRQSLIDLEGQLRYPRPSDGSTHYADVLVVTALRSPELSAILKLPLDFAPVKVDHDASEYYQGKLVNDRRSINVVAVAASDKGLAGAAIAASKGISAFWPKYVYMPGITAGIKGRTGIGDVIFADLSWDWGSGKIKRINKADVFLPAPYQRRLNETLSVSAKSMAENPESLMSHWQTSDQNKPVSPPVVRVGAMASGASVLQSHSAVKKVIEQHKDLLAIEMEAFSLMFACQTSPEPRPTGVVAKAVCDFGDGKKNDNYQSFAAEMSAKVFVDFARANFFDKA